MACRTFMKKYRGNVVARQYNMTRLKHFQQMQSRVNAIDEEWEDSEPEWMEMEASSVPRFGNAPVVVNLPVKDKDGSQKETTPVGIFNVDGELYAMDTRCPHMGGPLEKGPMKGSTVTCPWHRWCVDVKTGQVQHLQDMEDMVQPTYQVKKEGQKVMVCTRPNRVRTKKQQQ